MSFLPIVIFRNWIKKFFRHYIAFASCEGPANTDQQLKGWVKFHSYSSDISCYAARNLVEALETIIFITTITIFVIFMNLINIEKIRSNIVCEFELK